MKAILISLAMFTKLPVPIVDWEEKKGPLAILFFPFAGFFCGLLTIGCYYLITTFKLQTDIAAALMLLSLFFVSGLVHLDGLMDTSDAFLSARDKEKKIEILKDSKVGAFSVIVIVLFMIVIYASIKTLIESQVLIWFFLMTPILSRAYGSTVLLSFRPLSNTGILFYFHDGKKTYHIVISVLTMLACLVVFYLLGLNYLIAALIAILITFCIDIYFSKSINGINGDIIGASVILTETLTYLITAIIVL